ncbi:MAG: LamG domain-containing protein, partial [Gammaproteobacteria bacterium]
TTSGGTAAGRRVMLPLGRDDGVSLDHLNANGRLIVQRSLAWGMNADTVASGTNVLLVVVDPGNLNAQEAAKKALIESWGHTVNLIDESDNQTDFNTAIAANDVAYIPQDINSGNLGTKLRDATIGVVNEEGEQVDELGFSLDKIFKSRDEIDVVDNTHYITQLFATGLVTHSTASQSVHMLSGSEAPGLSTLGESFNTGSIWESSLAVLETGDALSGGGTAAGRRVELPWGGGTFDINLLTPDGLTIMQRAIEWGAGATAVANTPLLLVVADPANLTTQETAKKALIESWGYSVNLIDDAASPTEFVDAFAVNDVVYVSGDVSDASVGNNLLKTSLGVVNEQIALHDELLLSTSAGTNDFTNISVIDNAHDITTGFSTGWLTVTTANQPLNALEGTLAAGLHNLAEVWINGANYDYGLAVVDIGGDLNGGEIAAGRRVQIPWGTAGFDFTTLNGNGQTIMQRAIEWAGEGAVATGPVAHWKLDDGTGLTAVDSEGGHNGTLTTGGPTWVAGQIGDALDFDGIDDAIIVPHDDTLSLTQAMTFSAWVRSDAFGESGPYDLVVSKGTVATSYAYYFGALGDEIIFGFSADGAYREFTTPSLNLATDTWHHIAATFDNSSDQVRLYHDGVEVLAATTTYEPSATTHDLYIGSSEDGADWDGILDDVRIENRVMAADEISDLFNAGGGGGGGGGPQYIEAHDLWYPGSSDTWETVDLSTYGVPADAVVEVAVMNNNGNRENWAGVRAVGSSLERRFLLQEAEGGGNDVVVMHVQADSSSQIQTYADRTNNIVFILLGYWTGVTYVETFDSFSAGANDTWREHNLGTYGVGANQVAEIVMSQTSTSIEWLVGTRRSGSSQQRKVPLHEAEGGGVDAVTMLVEADASSIVEVYAEANSVVDFHLVGYWSTPPGTYAETGGVHGQATVSASWETTDLSSFGVPANSIAQFVLSNERDANENSMRVRATGSTINTRGLDLHEAESGGGDLGTIHVKVDGSSQIQWAAEFGATDSYFYPIGWWVLN